MDKRTELVEKLNESVEALHEVTRNDKHFRMSIFLHQSINMHADEETLAKIITDIEKQIHLRKTEPEKFM